jgi:hypothetical protein
MCKGARLQSRQEDVLNERDGALQAAEKLVRVVGRGFIHGIKPIESVRALAPEACLFWISTKSGLFPQPV